MRRGRIRQSGARLVWTALAIASCAIAETKLPPQPTVEYLPCSGMSLGAGPGEPLGALLDIAPDAEAALWGGSWTIGESTHIGLTDVGAVDWQVACRALGEPGLVVHEVPFLLTDLTMWADVIADRIADSDDPGSADRELVVDAGQYVVEIRADTVEEAALLAGDVPAGAWAYGGQLSSGSG